MKRFISVIVFILIWTVLAEGEEMKFVTVLSSPVGTFAHLETANPTRAVQSPVVNFGTSRVSTGRMELKGAAGYIEELHLKSGTELGGNAGAYRVAEGMEVGTGGRLPGGRLMANEVDFSGALEGKSEVKGSLYTDEISVAGAKAGSLTIPDEVELTASSGEEEVLEWSNEYTCDYEQFVSGDGEVTVSGWMNIANCRTNSDTCNWDSMGEFDVDSLKGRKDPLSCVDVSLSADCTAYIYESTLDNAYNDHSCTLDYNAAHWNPPQYKYKDFPKGHKDFSVNCPAAAFVTGYDVSTGWASLLASYWNKLIQGKNFTELKKYVTIHADGSVKLGCSGGCRHGCYHYSGSVCYITAYFYPIISGTCSLKCRNIDYVPPPKESKCREGSPTYDSYLLKSTTSSSDSKEEGTEG